MEIIDYQRLTSHLLRNFPLRTCPALCVEDLPVFPNSDLRLMPNRTVPGIDPEFGTEMPGSPLPLQASPQDSGHAVRFGQPWKKSSIGWFAASMSGRRPEEGPA